MGSNREGVKKVNASAAGGEECNRDSGICYPSPYELTKLTNCDGNSGMETVTLVRHPNAHTTPLKPVSGDQHQEPMYETPRALRNECHVYQYPWTLKGTLVRTDVGSCFETDSCVSLTSSNPDGHPSSTAFIRLQDDSGDKNLSGMFL